MISIIDAEIGNLTNVQKAVEKLGHKTIITNKPADIKSSQGIILPGVGAFGEAMEHLGRAEIVEVLREEVLANNKPIFGICLGMQLLARNSFENGESEGLNILPMVVKKLHVTSSEHGLPHMGWNNIKITQQCRLFNGISGSPDFYFAHSYAVACDDESIEVAKCDYCQDFVCAVEHKNIMATQFHVEKSQAMGLKVLSNFLQTVKKE